MTDTTTGFALAFAGGAVFALLFWMAHTVHPFSPLVVLALVIIGLVSYR